MSYVERIKQALDRIHSDLTQPLRLNELAELAGLSPFHFHRVFQAIVGETPSGFVKRLRLEKALYLIPFWEGKVVNEDCLRQWLFQFVRFHSQFQESLAGRARNTD